MLLARWPKRQRCRASLSRSRRPSPRWRLSKGRAPRHPLGRARRFDPVGLIAFTSDITLASRCVKSGADVIAPTGKRFSESSIGMALATRNLMDDLRRISDIGAQCLWPPRPFEFPQCARQRGRAATAFGDDALLMTPIGVERRAERHAGARAVRGPAPSVALGCDGTRSVDRPRVAPIHIGVCVVIWALSEPLRRAVDRSSFSTTSNLVW